MARLERETRKKKPFDLPAQAVVLNVLRNNELFQHRFSRLFREYGLTQPQYNVLRILRGEGRPLPCLEIADRMIAVVPAITRLVDKLEARALVTKRQDALQFSLTVSGCTTSLIENWRASALRFSPVTTMSKGMPAIVKLGVSSSADWAPAMDDKQPTSRLETRSTIRRRWMNMGYLRPDGRDRCRDV